MNTIKLKSATFNDINFLIKLYNDKSIQNNSLNTDSFEITNKEVISTLKYFYSNNLEYYIIYSGNIKIGIALIYEVNIKEMYCLVGVALLEKYRGHGFSRIIIHELVKNSFSKYKITTLASEIYSNNLPSLKLMEKLNFKKDISKSKEVIINNQKIYSYFYKKSYTYLLF